MDGKGPKKNKREEGGGGEKNGFSGFDSSVVVFGQFRLNLNCEECSALEEERVFRVQGW